MERVVGHFTYVQVLVISDGKKTTLLLFHWAALSTTPNFRVCAQLLNALDRGMLQIWHILYRYTKTQSCFFHFSFRATLFFPLMNALVYVDIDLGIH